MSTSDATEPTEATAQPSNEPFRAPFLADLPDDPALRKLAEAFERGNYALVRKEAPRLVEQAESDAVRQAARDLLQRIEPDPLMKYLLLLSVLLLIVVTIFVYVAHDSG